MYYSSFSSSTCVFLGSFIDFKATKIIFSDLLHVRICRLEPGSVKPEVAEVLTGPPGASAVLQPGSSLKCGRHRKYHLRYPE